MCEQINGLRQYKNSCWFDACMAALFIQTDNFYYYQHIFTRTEFGSNKIRSELGLLVDAMRTGKTIELGHGLRLSNLMRKENIIHTDTRVENSADNLIKGLLKFGRFKPNVCAGIPAYIYTFNKINKKTYLSEMLHTNFEFEPKYLIIKSIQNKKFIPDNELNISKNKLYLNSIMVLRNSHYVTYIRCDNNIWYVYDGERAKNGFPLSRMSYFNIRLPNDKFITELHAVSTSKKTLVYDYTNTTDSICSYFFYTQKIPSVV